jgi:hypothetical protein
VGTQQICYERQKLAQLLGQLGVFLTYSGFLTCASCGCGVPSASRRGAQASAFFSSTLSGTAETQVLPGPVSSNWKRTWMEVMQRGWWGANRPPCSRCHICQRMPSPSGHGAVAAVPTGQGSPKRGAGSAGGSRSPE